MESEGGNGVSVGIQIGSDASKKVSKVWNSTQDKDSKGTPSCPCISLIPYLNLLISFVEYLQFLIDSLSSVNEATNESLTPIVDQNKADAKQNGIKRQKVSEDA